MKLAGHKTPLFSVIIDNFNYGCYVEEAIDSVLNQTLPRSDIEILIVDDGSTDDSAERLKRYEDRVTCIFKQNGGQASALNAGIAAAHGEVICFLDSDDYWHPKKLERISAAFSNSGRMDFVYHFMKVVDNSRKVIDRYVFPSPLPEKGSHSGERYLDRYLRGILPFFPPTSGLSIRADCMRKVGPIPEEFGIAADLYLHYIVPFYLRELSMLREPLGYYRMHGDNLSGGNLPSVKKMKRERGILSILGKYIDEHSWRLGYDDGAIKQRMSAVAGGYTIIIHNLEGQKIRALKAAVLFDNFLPEDPMMLRIMRKMILSVSAVIPSSLYLWLQRRYRSLLYLLHRRARRSEGEAGV